MENYIAPKPNKIAYIHIAPSSSFVHFPTMACRHSTHANTLLWIFSEKHKRLAHFARNKAKLKMIPPVGVSFLSFSSYLLFPAFVCAECLCKLTCFSFFSCSWRVTAKHMFTSNNFFLCYNSMISIDASYFYFEEFKGGNQKFILNENLLIKFLQHLVPIKIKYNLFLFVCLCRFGWLFVLTQISIWLRILFHKCRL